MRRILTTGLIGLAVLLGLGGCATAPSPVDALPVDVYLDGRGSAMVLNEQVPVADLPRLLKRTHVQRQCTIAVHVPDTGDKRAMAELTALLAQAGYHRVTFVGVRQAKSAVR